MIRPEFRCLAQDPREVLGYTDRRVCNVCDQQSVSSFCRQLPSIFLRRSELHAESVVICVALCCPGFSVMCAFHLSPSTSLFLSSISPLDRGLVHPFFLSLRWTLRACTSFVSGPMEHAFLVWKELSKVPVRRGNDRGRGDNAFEVGRRSRANRVRVSNDAVVERWETLSLTHSCRRLYFRVFMGRKAAAAAGAIHRGDGAVGGFLCTNDGIGCRRPTL
jgi:hypothetical protein